MVKANYKKKQKQEKNQKKHEENAGKSSSEQKVNLAKGEHFFFRPIIPDCLKTNFKKKLSAR